MNNNYQKPMDRVKGVFTTIERYTFGEDVIYGNYTNPGIKKQVDGIVNGLKTAEVRVFKNLTGLGDDIETIVPQLKRTVKGPQAISTLIRFFQKLGREYNIEELKQTDTIPLGLVEIRKKGKRMIVEMFGGKVCPHWFGPGASYEVFIYGYD